MVTVSPSGPPGLFKGVTTPPPEVATGWTKTFHSRTRNRSEKGEGGK
jgi:hypothetical protein